MQNLNINNYYFHSIIHGSDNSLKVMEGIFSSGYIKSPNELGIKKRNGCHKADEICLSHKRSISYPNKYVSSFDIYLPFLTTLIIDKEISHKFKVIQPKIVTTRTIFRNQYNGNATNIYDEYRINKSIPVQYIKGISIPFETIINDPFLFCLFYLDDCLIDYYNGKISNSIINGIRMTKNSPEDIASRKDFVEDYTNKIRAMIDKYNLDIPVYEYNCKKLKLR